ncbi:MAG: hypothetical protein A2086_01525 [Spirochaetes bacterium GWD1_27_9]|nr:MAG: hypothetical protein A2Z98_08880 [Spirochaetes bacterium GWB1_27_13]OHD28069.1 MAG: hypothetical protein A2Y34_02685 [Spirochaetes bacterium GWC1_27_15]OHD41755.1 MAG: hypothetical protein A2086_01525 [Spirochaetes bacterium GWD1_27_9]
MYKIGLKLWSINKQYVEEAIKLYETNFIQYVELYVIPDSYKETVTYWENLNIPYIIHAPHFSHGLNFAKKEQLAKNITFANEALKYADSLKSEIIIFHPGVEGHIEETTRQLKIINDSRIVIENKPYYSLDGKFICVGYSKEEIEFVTKNAKIGFCLDIGHAICAANSKKIKPFYFLEEFIKLNPKMYHLTDGDFDGVYDKHLHFGNGSFPIKQILKLIPPDSLITNEAKKDSNDNLLDFVKDIDKFREYL